MPDLEAVDADRPASWSAADWPGPHATFQHVLTRTFATSRLVVDSAPDSDVVAARGIPRPRSCRRFDPRRLSRDERAQLLAPLVAVDGIAPYPSAGSLYPCHPFIAEPVDAHTVQLSYLNGATGALNRVRTVEEKTLASAVFEDWAWPVGCLIIVVADFTRVSTQYGERGLRFALLEAGMMLERAATAAHRIRLDTCVVGGYDDLALGELLHLDPRWYGVAALLAVGDGGIPRPA